MAKTRTRFSSACRCRAPRTLRKRRFRRSTPRSGVLWKMATAIFFFLLRALTRRLAGPRQVPLRAGHAGQRAHRRGQHLHREWHPRLPRLHLVGMQEVQGHAGHDAARRSAAPSTRPKTRSGQRRRARNPSVPPRSGPSGEKCATWQDLQVVPFKTIANPTPRLPVFSRPGLPPTLPGAVPGREHVIVNALHGAAEDRPVKAVQGGAAGLGPEPCGQRGVAQEVGHGVAEARQSWSGASHASSPCVTPLAAPAKQTAGFPAIM